jgi:hypothetical protein
MFLFTTKEVAELLDWNIHSINNLVHLGRIRPAVRGHRGKYPSCFSFQQCLGFAIHKDLLDLTRNSAVSSIIGGRLLISAVMRSWEQLPDEKLVQWARASTVDAWKKEAVAQAALINALAPPDIEIPDDFGHRFVRVWQEIQKRIKAMPAGQGFARPRRQKVKA